MITESKTLLLLLQDPGRNDRRSLSLSKWLQSVGLSSRSPCPTLTVESSHDEMLMEEDVMEKPSSTNIFKQTEKGKAEKHVNRKKLG